MNMATKKLQLLGSFGGTVTTDKTLTLEGEPADAKAVGDNINLLSKKVEELYVGVEDIATLVGGEA